MYQPGITFTDSYKKFQLTSYMVKYALEPLSVLQHLKSIALHWFDTHKNDPRYETAQMKYLALERAIEQKQDLQTLNDVQEVLL